MPPNLSSYYETRRNGKVSDKWSLYLDEYNRLFSTYQYSHPSILEIGVQNGGSLEIWSNFFGDTSTIVGCDINPKCQDLQFESSNIKLVVGDINDTTTRKGISAYATSFDIVIDDGSHVNSDVIDAFCNLFPLVNDGGIYVVEDLHTSYWHEFGGGLFNKQSAYAFFKALIDICNSEHWGTHIAPNVYLSALGFNIPAETLETFQHIHSIEFLNSMCVVRKLNPSKNVLGPRVVSGDAMAVVELKGHSGDTVKSRKGDDESCTPAPLRDSCTDTTDHAAPISDDLVLIADRFRDALLNRDAIILRKNEQLHLLRDELTRAEAQLELLKELTFNYGQEDIL